MSSDHNLQSNYTEVPLGTKSSKSNDVTSSVVPIHINFNVNERRMNKTFCSNILSAQKMFRIRSLTIIFFFPLAEQAHVAAGIQLEQKQTRLYGMHCIYLNLFLLPTFNRSPTSHTSNRKSNKLICNCCSTTIKRSDSPFEITHIRENACYYKCYLQ